MNKKTCIFVNLILLLWFFLDMTGMRINNHILVTRSYKEDGIFFLIFLLVFILFILKDRIGKYFLTTWLFLWFMTQFSPIGTFPYLAHGKEK